MQLVAYGAQDVYLTGNPNITLFKVVYRRHTNFAMECIGLSFDSRFGGKASVQVLRNGDLATKSYLYFELPALVPTNAGTSAGSFNGKIAWMKRLGHAMLDHVEVTIGGSTIDKHWGMWLDIWYELTHEVDQERGYSAMVGDVSALTTLVAGSTGVAGGYSLYVPLQFWFNRNYGLALPLIALQYHDVRVNVEFEDAVNLIVYTWGLDSTGATGTAAPKFNGGLAFNTASILVDYVYLDSEERRRFAQVGHEYLIEQIQYNQANLQSGGTQTIALNFNQPCKELIWTHLVGAFTGAAGGNLGGGSGSTFLGYTDKVWATDGLKVCAENLARSMLSLSNTGSGSWSSAITTGSKGYTTVTFNGTTFVINMVNTGSGLGTSIYIQQTPLLVGTTQLGTKLKHVSVVIDTTKSTLDAAILSLTVLDHTLTVLDVSSVVSHCTDNRATKGNDATVVQLNYGVSLDGTGNLVSAVSGQGAKITLNGHDRFAVRDGNYFNYVQPSQHHTRTPADGVNVYSFGLHPEQHQPTGTCNFSRIDSARLIYQVVDPFAATRADTSFSYTTNTTVNIFVTNYNILRVMSGMGGLAYSS